LIENDKFNHLINILTLIEFKFLFLINETNI